MLGFVCRNTSPQFAIHILCREHVLASRDLSSLAAEFDGFLIPDRREGPSRVECQILSCTERNVLRAATIFPRDPCVDVPQFGADQSNNGVFRFYLHIRTNPTNLQPSGKNYFSPSIQRAPQPQSSLPFHWP